VGAAEGGIAHVFKGVGATVRVAVGAGVGACQYMILISDLSRAMKVGERGAPPWARPSGLLWAKAWAPR
jgi:hypothetical protein